MNKHQQSGMTTLLITSMLLIVALLFSLASYKNLFYQIKRTQNEVLARQAHWAAEGGLECGFAAIQDAGSISGARPTFNDCETSLKLADVDVDDETMVSTYDNLAKATINKKIKFKRGSSSGAIKSSSDIYINGSSYFPTVDPGELAYDGWECVAIRYKNIFSALAGATNVGVTTIEPYSGFIEKNNNKMDCKKSNKTNIAVNGPFGMDFFNDENLEPFEDLFNEKRTNWNRVKTGLNFVIIDDPSNIKDGNKVISECGKKIANEVEKNANRRLWVDGSCEIKDTEIDLLKKAFVDNSEPILLLIHDGIFAINGSMNFPGMLYHLNTDFTPTATFWDNFDTKAYFGNYSLFPGLEKKNTVYHQRGSFVFSGGQVLDSPGYAAYFEQSLNFSFNRDNIDKVVSPYYVIEWQQGSWHDF
jgi:hypothetical protein